MKETYIKHTCDECKKEKSLRDTELNSEWLSLTVYQQAYYSFAGHDRWYEHKLNFCSPECLTEYVKKNLTKEDK